MKYERIRYPDNQISARVLEVEEKKVVYITERINNYEDLIFVLSLAQVYRRLGKKVVLTIPCLLAQRSDRTFSQLQSFDLEIVASIINSAEFKEVRILDPHSSVALALVKNSVALTINYFVSDVIYDIQKRIPEQTPVVTLVSPDAGAYKKVFDLAQDFEVPLVAAVKHRDLQGKLDLVFTGDVKGRTCLIVDDICSRGTTFINLATQLKKQGANKVYLYVTHFEGGGKDYKETITNLKNTIDHIFTTNSYREFDDADLKTLTVLNFI